jgi:hypothetical protein
MLKIVILMLKIVIFNVKEPHHRFYECHVGILFYVYHGQISALYYTNTVCWIFLGIAH